VPLGHRVLELAFPNLLYSPNSHFGLTASVPYKRADGKCPTRLT